MRPEKTGSSNIQSTGPQSTSAPPSSVTHKKDSSSLKLLFISGWQSTRAAFRSAGNKISAAASFLGNLISRLNHSLQSLTEKKQSAKGHVQHQSPHQKSVMHIQDAGGKKKDPTASIPISRLSLPDAEEKLEFELFIKSEEKPGTVTQANRQKKEADSAVIDPEKKYEFEPALSTAYSSASDKAAPASEQKLVAGLIAQFSTLRHIELPDSLPGAPQKNYEKISQHDVSAIQIWLRKNANETSASQGTNIPGVHKLARAMSAEFLNGLPYEERLRIVVADFEAAAKGTFNTPPSTPSAF